MTIGPSSSATIKSPGKTKVSPHAIGTLKSQGNKFVCDAKNHFRTKAKLTPMFYFSQNGAK